MTRILTALFADRAAADRARAALRRLGLPRERIGLHEDPDKPTLPATDDAPGGEAWLPALLDTLFLPEADFVAHREALRRGGVVVSAAVEDDELPEVARALDEAGAQDMDHAEEAWRREGWSPAAAAGAVSGDPAALPATMPGTGGMDRESARQARAPDPAGTAPHPRRLARRELAIGRTRSYVIEAPLAEEPDLAKQVANSRDPGRGGA